MPICDLVKFDHIKNERFVIVFNNHTLYKVMHIEDLYYYSSSQ